MSGDHRRDWDRYWRDASSVPVFGQFNEDGRVLEKHWVEFLSHALAHPERTYVLDMACGSGAVSTISMQVAAEIGRSDAIHFSLDYSASAVSHLRACAPAVKPTASDARATPFPDASFDVIASQFGLEYAGPEAFAEASRLVAEEGAFCAICHLDDGPIHRECVENAEAMQAVLDCRFLPLAKSAFSALYALDKGAGPLHAAERSHRAFAEAAASVRRMIEEKGAHVASSTPARLHRDVGYMYNRRQNFESRQVLEWLDAMTDEIAAYAGRMRAMSDAALDRTAIHDIRQSMISAGLTAAEPGTLRMGANAEPGAWLLEAAR